MKELYLRKVIRIPFFSYPFIDYYAFLWYYIDIANERMSAFEKYTLYW